AQRSAVWRQLQLLERLPTGRVPDPVPAVDDLHLDEETTLTVARPGASCAAPGLFLRGRVASAPWSAHRAARARTAEWGCRSHTGRIRTGTGCGSRRRPGDDCTSLPIAARSTPCRARTRRE